MSFKATSHWRRVKDHEDDQSRVKGGLDSSLSPRLTLQPMREIWPAHMNHLELLPGTRHLQPQTGTVAGNESSLRGVSSREQLIERAAEMDEILNAQRDATTVSSPRMSFSCSYTFQAPQSPGKSPTSHPKFPVTGQICSLSKGARQSSRKNEVMSLLTLPETNRLNRVAGDACS
jgi:hypothetical protein